MVALDAKATFDDNALFRHKDILELLDPDEQDPIEIEAIRHRLSYIKLDGNVGCMVNGAGLAMATMDIIKLPGQSPPISWMSAAGRLPSRWSRLSGYCSQIKM